MTATTCTDMLIAAAYFVWLSALAVRSAYKDSMQQLEASR